MAPYAYFWLCLALGCAAGSGESAGSTDDQHLSLLQLSTRGTRASPRSSSFAEGLERNLTGITKPLPAHTVAPMDCRKYSKPIQVYKSDTGYNVDELNVTTGKYTHIYEIPFTRVAGKYTELNGCGINPVDGILYCAIFAGGAYIVRVDNKSMEFCVRLPWFIWNSGSVAPSGTFFVGTKYGRFLAIQDIHKAPGFPPEERSTADYGEYDLRTKQRELPPNWKQSADDAVIVNRDLEGTGELAEYIVVPYGARLQIAKYDPKLDKFTKGWSMKALPPRWDNIYGAGWNYQGQVFFAANRGSGVYQIPLESIPFNETLPKDYTVQLIKIGESKATNSNDGANCINMPNRWKTEALPHDCAFTPGLVQCLRRTENYEVAYLNFTTGVYETVYYIYKNLTSPPLITLNAFAIGPNDGVAYASLVLDVWDADIYPTPPPFYIVRVDEEKIEFVAKVQAPLGRPIAGSFDAHGNFWLVSNPYLFKFEGIEEFEGYKDQHNVEMPFYVPPSKANTDGKWLPLETIMFAELTGTKQISDIVALPGNFDGMGKEVWIIAANAFQQVILVKTTGKNAGKHWIFPTNDVIGEPERQNFGAGWDFRGEVFFSSNDGKGVFQIPLDQLKVPPKEGTRIILEKVGTSEAISDNDGMNCRRTASPYGPKRGTYVPPFGSHAFFQKKKGEKSKK